VIAKSGIGLFIGLLCLGILWGGHTTAESASVVACTNLQVTLSDDKNFYIFTARAAGDDTPITGYTFDFGDRQSYDFTFAPSSSQDHHTATVTHAYQKSGSYAVTVQARTKETGQSTKTTPKKCKATVQVGADMLPDTGAGLPLALVAFTACVSALAHYLFRRYRGSVGQ
jgi:hypothetical protein